MSQTSIWSDEEEAEAVRGSESGLPLLSCLPWEVWIERHTRSLPLLSWWSQPQRSGTFTWHFLWTFMSHALHLSPWCRRPYNMLPHWSQKVGEVKVCITNVCCLTPPPLPLSSPWQEKLTYAWHLRWTARLHVMHWNPCFPRPQMKSWQWQQNVGVLKNLAANLHQTYKRNKKTSQEMSQPVHMDWSNIPSSSWGRHRVVFDKQTRKDTCLLKESSSSSYLWPRTTCSCFFLTAPLLSARNPSLSRASSGWAVDAEASCWSCVALMTKSSRLVRKWNSRKQNNSDDRNRQILQFKHKEKPKNHELMTKWLNFNLI